jgi:hypothetical protein
VPHEAGVAVVAAAGKREQGFVGALSGHFGENGFCFTRINTARGPERTIGQPNEVGATEAMLGFVPGPFLKGRLALSNPAEGVASFAADHGDHLPIGHESNGGFVWMARHIQMRDEVIFHAVAAGNEL